MDKVEKAARAMARADDVEPDKPLERLSTHRIVGKMMPVYRYDPNLPAWNYYVPIAKLFLAAAEALKAD